MTKIARIEAKDGAGARVAGPRVRLGAPRREARSQYYAFLSYSHKDEELAEWLHGELEEFHVPAALSGRLTANGVIPRKLAPIFRDKQELAAATDLGEEIRAALAASQFLVVLCSPAAAESRWTNAEIDAFKRSRPDGSVFAVIASGEPFASDVVGREAEECFPPALRERYDKRGRATGKRAEPIAADLRGDADDRRLGFLKLVAGMLGVGLDDLVRRETTRRQRRMAWVTGASLVGMVFASGLAITAIQARDAARDQRREAEGLVAFMLGDLKDKLEPIGKLDALDGVGSRVLAYYSKQDASELADNALMQRSRALSLSAQVAYLRGNLETARRLYREAMAGTAEAIKRSPDDPQRLFEHAQNVFYFGSIAADRGDLSGAERAFRDYGRLANQMASLQSDNLRWKMETQYAAANLGFVLLRQRRFDEAVRQFGAALGTIEAVAAVDPANADYQKSLAASLAWLADAQLARGDITLAFGARRRQVDLLKALADRSGDVAFNENLIPAQQTLGNLLAAMGREKEAAIQIEAAVATAEKLLPAEPGNSHWAVYAGRAHLRLAQQFLDARMPGEAEPHVAKGCQYARSLKNPRGAADSQMLQGTCLSRQAQLALAQGNSTAAQSYSNRAFAIAGAVHSPDFVGDRYRLARNLLLVGDCSRAAGDDDRARRAWMRALSLTNAAREQPGESAVRAELLDRTGQPGLAEGVRAALAARGIRDAMVLSV
ncbi:MAG: toll/interleukin-1 receptor domain-containing protein [Sphingomicrobium sp.]